LLNGFEGPAGGGTLPEEFSFAGGAPGIHATLQFRTAERETVILMGNIGPFAGDAIARRIRAILEE
jgi:hypothetical protein